MKKGIYILMCMCILLAGCSSEQSGKKAAKKKAVTAKVQKIISADFMASL